VYFFNSFVSRTEYRKCELEAFDQVYMYLFSWKRLV